MSPRPPRSTRTDTPLTSTTLFRSVELQLLGGGRHPALAEAFPGQRRDRAGAQHGPHRHFEGAGVGAGDDADAVGFGQVQQFAHQVDAISEAGLADLGAVREAAIGRASCRERGCWYVWLLVVADHFNKKK